MNTTVLDNSTAQSFAVSVLGSTPSLAVCGNRYLSLHMARLTMRAPDRVVRAAESDDPAKDED